MQNAIDDQIAKAARVVRSVALVMPRREEMGRELVDAENAQSRGHFLPDEDERIREVFARYLSLRGVLLETLDSMQGVLDQQRDVSTEKLTEERHLRTFMVGFTAATMLVRAANFMIGLAKDRAVVWEKLDEAEPRYGIPAKSYTMVYKNLSSARRMWRYYEALKYYEVHREDVSLLECDADVGELVHLLMEEEPFFETSKRSYVRKKWGYRLHSFKRRHMSGYKKVMFHLLKLSGSAIAEMRQPFVKAPGQGKRVTKNVLSTLKPNLKAGDVFITRHDDALSNLFLPGFWPHAALYIGDQTERDTLGIALPPQDGRCLQEFQFLEAKKDGVLFRALADTLEVDAFMVLRPKLEESQLAEALNRALTHEGKLYDFIFDFRKADRLACTEVIYRSYHGIGDVSFELRRHSGRLCLSAEDLIEQALGSGWFEKVVEFGVESDVLSFS